MKVTKGFNGIENLSNSSIKFDAEIEALRSNGKPFFEYVGFDIANSKQLLMTKSINHV